MNRWLLIGSMVGLLITATGCLHHHTRSGGGGCHQCGTPAAAGGGHGQCGGDCGGAACGQRNGLLGKLRGRLRGDACGGDCGGACGGAHGGAHGAWRPGCVAGPLGWQQGGLDYSSHLRPGALGHRAARQLQNQPFQPGPPSAQVGYPYYTHRGPRDFFLDDPPTIGR